MAALQIWNIFIMKRLGQMMNYEFASFRVVDKAERRALQLPDLGKVGRLIIKMILRWQKITDHNDDKKIGWQKNWKKEEV